MGGLPATNGMDGPAARWRQGVCGFPGLRSETWGTHFSGWERQAWMDGAAYRDVHCSFQSAIQMLPVRSPMLNTSLLPAMPSVVSVWFASDSRAS